MLRVLGRDESGSTFHIAAGRHVGAQYVAGYHGGHCNAVVCHVLVGTALINSIKLRRMNRAAHRLNAAILQALLV